MHKILQNCATISTFFSYSGLNCHILAPVGCNKLTGGTSSGEIHTHAVGGQPLYDPQVWTQCFCHSISDLSHFSLGIDSHASVNSNYHCRYFAYSFIIEEAMTIFGSVYSPCATAKVECFSRSSHCPSTGLYLLSNQSSQHL